MTANAPNRDAVVLTVEAIGIRKYWGWFLALGVVQIIAGSLAVGFAFSATLASVVMLGSLLLVAAGTQIAVALLARHWDAFFLFLLLGTVYGVAGFLTLKHPVLAAEGLTLMLAALFLLVGLFRIAVTVVEPPRSGAGCCLTASSPRFWALPSGGSGPRLPSGCSACSSASNSS